MSRFFRVTSACAVIVIGLPSLYGQTDCETNANYPSIVAPTQGEMIPASGLFTATVTFDAVLTASSLVELELQTGMGSTTIDVAPLFLPPGQSNFAGMTGASAELDAAALGLVPGPQSFFIRLDADGVGGPSVRVVSFSWNGQVSCEAAASTAVSSCFLDVSEATRQCYMAVGSACAASDPAVAGPENQLHASIASACSDQDVRSAGYGTLMTSAALADRLVEVCAGNAATLAARLFGGPHGKVLSGGLGQACMDAAYAESASFTDLAFNLQRDCVLAAACDPVALRENLQSIASQSTGMIDTACPSEFLEFLVGVPAAEAISLARAQSECMVAAALGDTTPLALACAPNALPGVTVVETKPAGLTPFAPGVPTQLMLDGAEWGTKCGDGSPYAFWVQLPPAGSSPSNVAVHMQGGGVCVLQSQCERVAADSPGLLDALGDEFNASGIFNPDPAQNAFADWTKIFLPYCTQDVFTGGGVLQDFGTVSIERYGARNARAALRVLRNILAGKMNDTSADGYRPDLLQVMFSGSSAGGFGVMFNLHHLIDEERWVNTTSLNDAALGLDTGTPLGVGALGSIAQAGWATRLTQPPYCLGGDCVVGPVLNAAHSERLLATPTQQLIILSNQVDGTQVSTTGWPDTVSFVNEVRAQYCAAETLPGVRYFLDATPSSVHTYLTSNTRYFSSEIAGVTLSDWVEQSISDPSNLANLVEEGALSSVYPGVLPFACSAQ